MTIGKKKEKEHENRWRLSKEENNNKKEKSRKRREIYCSYTCMRKMIKYVNEGKKEEEGRE